MVFVLGLTGGIGSGKTAASDYLQTRGICVVDADQVARQVVEPGEPALTAIVEQFGSEVLQEDGSLDRRALRQRVFADPDERRALEAITHPAIAAEILRQLQEADSPYVILASPLLLETSQRQMANRILLIDAPEAVQVARTRTRDETSEEQVRAIMAAQMSRQERLALADDVITNDGQLTDLHNALDQLHAQYLEMARHD